MDPSKPQPQVDNPNLGKLEEDLQNLTKEVSAQAPQAASATAPPTPVIATPPTEAPSVLEPVTPLPESTPPAEKKTSPVLIVALVLMVIAILASIAYVVGIKFFTPQATPVPTATTEVIPTVEPTVTPVATATSSALPTATSSARPTVTPKASAIASATPSASPQ